MVTTRPTPLTAVPQPLRQAANNPPYPNDSGMLHTVEPQPRRSYEYVNSQGPSALNGEGGTRSRGSSISSHGTWNSDPSEPEQQEPASTLPLSAGRSSEQAGAIEGLPLSLRLGVPRKPVPTAPSSPEWTSQQQSSTFLQSHNPYKTTQPSYQNPQLSGLDTIPNQTSELRHSSDEAQFLAPNRPNNTIPFGRSPSQPPPSIPVERPVLEKNFTGKSNTSQVSQSSNPWQADLDKDGASTTLSPGSPLIDLTPQYQPKDKHGIQTTAKAAQSPHESGPAALTEHASGMVTPRTEAKRQRNMNEYYHIKHINWFDVSIGPAGALRRSPILTQNANGPCPLLALVNALSLSTPAGEKTSLIQTLEVREQITLGLLIDAMFEELMRRNETSDHQLPDMGALYSFFLTLHTGMNVNPAFTVSSPSVPGGFEQTREMQLYSAFNIPLLHGWTSPPGSETYLAFERSARTFDEALNMQFLEEELESKLKSQGLSREEERVFQDMVTGKRFLAAYPTQLSDYGLDVLGSWLKPGQIAILFRNDHFCTLYKEPKKGTLMALVTDSGYATHDEIVWESLVDVNGAQAEFFSGDFRPVGTSSSGVGQMSHSAEGSSNSWQTATVPISHTTSDPKTPHSEEVSQAQSHSTSQNEQEDLDLAFALQLQEEEEEAERRESARRQDAQNESLSRRFLERESDEPERRPQIPPRRSHRPSQPQQAPQMQSSARTDEGTVPPPTYEQAANDMPYREAGSTPRPPGQGNPLGALNALDAQRHQSAFAAQSGQHSPMHAPSYGRRRSSRFGSAYPPAQQGAYASGRYGANEERCLVM